MQHHTRSKHFQISIFTIMSITIPRRSHHRCQQLKTRTKRIKRVNPRISPFIKTSHHRIYQYHNYKRWNSPQLYRKSLPWTINSSHLQQKSYHSPNQSSPSTQGPHFLQDQNRDVHLCGLPSQAKGRLSSSSKNILWGRCPTHVCQWLRSRYLQPKIRDEV